MEENQPITQGDPATPEQGTAMVPNPPQTTPAPLKAKRTYKRRGPPKKNEAEKRNETIAVKITKWEKKLIAKWCVETGLGFSDYGRQAMLAPIPKHGHF